MIDMNNTMIPQAIYINRDPNDFLGICFKYNGWYFYADYVSCSILNKRADEDTPEDMACFLYKKPNSITANFDYFDEVKPEDYDNPVFNKIIDNMLDGFKANKDKLDQAVAMKNEEEAYYERLRNAERE